MAILVLLIFVFMLKHALFQVWWGLTQALAPGPTADMEMTIRMSDTLTEASGMVFWSDEIYVINDGGNSPSIYLLNDDGSIKHEALQSTATNVDWEELTTSDRGVFFIGDFGNNNNNRNNQKIYITNPVRSNIPLYPKVVDTINLKFTNQKDFPAKEKDRHFDMEAMFHFKDSLYLFSKNRAKPNTGYTYMYKFSDAPNTYELSPVDSFLVKKGGFRAANWISGAAISPDGKNMILLTYNKFWLFTDYKGSDFFSGKVQRINLPTYTQKEAVCFITNSTILIADEKNPASGGKIYYIDIAEYLNND